MILKNVVRSKRFIVVGALLCALMLVFSGCGKKKEDAKTYQKENDVKNVSSENTNSQDNKVSSSEKNENSTSDKNQSENKKDDNSNKQSDDGISFRDVELIVKEYLKIEEFSKSDAEKLNNIMGFEPGYNAEGDYYVSNVEGRQIINKLSESIVTRELARQILSEFKTNESGFIKVLSDGNDEAYDTFEILDSVKKQKNVYEVTYFGWNAKAGRDAGKSEKKTFTFEKNDDGDYVIKSVTK